MLKANLWDWVKAIISIIVVFFLSLKFYNATFTMNFDFIALLSTVLALFSVGLSAVFYFKATETSNDFYNNTFKFTKDIADLLIRIESGFGERLKSLDEGYNSMRSIMASPRNSGVNQMKEKIEVDESELSKINAERSELINKLLEKANLEHEEKEKIKEELKIKEEESQKLQFELTRLKKRLFASRMSSRDQQGGEGFSFDSDMKKRLVQNYIASTIVPDIIESYEINASDVLLSSREIQNYFNNKHWGNGKTQFAKDMVRLGYCVPGEGLTLSGARYIRSLLRTALREL
ncbi:hypothetical protein [Klebsiella michiganensis]|uniref:hypothetical protein n=1 Tax=Klebsiella michiganensis TaxID=1134687 RepID=UPI002DB85FA4|nr:hypothetical protein [Klebsiella michiganensis]MEB6371411.1 hypothetical protein [Klebsiella michiganensis]